MEYTYKEKFNLREFIEANHLEFERTLLSEAVNVKDKIDEILAIGNIDLVNNAHALSSYIIEGKEEELCTFAKQEGIAWATHSIDLTFKLEWIQAIRRTLWSFIEVFQEYSNGSNIKDFFDLERQINNQVDDFLNTFFIKYSTYKDALLKAHRELVEKLSVPIIPITPSVSILPLIGAMDSLRMSVLQEKVLTEIGSSRIQTLIMDLSGIADMEADVIDQLMKVIDGGTMMGCNTVITGLRPDVVRKIVSLGFAFDQNTITLGTLQQALKKYFR